MQTHVHANERPSRFLKSRIEGFREVLIQTWNELLTRCEAMLDQREIDQTLNAGGRVLPNLAKFRKTSVTQPFPTADFCTVPTSIL
jgi:hypothetical protein